MKLFTDIKAFFFDVDGVLTDGNVLALETGEMARRVNSKDAFAIQLALKLGYTVAVISGGNAKGVRRRMEQLGVRELHFKSARKLPVYEQIKTTHELQDREIMYIGDDLPDTEVMAAAGLAACPADAADDVLIKADYITRRPGGHGAVR